METTDLRHKSRTILEGRDRAPARSYLKGMGFSEEDLNKPITRGGLRTFEPLTLFTPGSLQSLRRATSGR